MEEKYEKKHEKKDSWNIKNGFITCWLAFCFIVSIITFIIYFTRDVSHYQPENVIKKKEPISFHTLLNYRDIRFNATWVSDDEILTQDDSSNIVLYDVNKSIKSILAFNSMQHMRYCNHYELSADKKYLLIAYNVDNTISYLPRGNYDVINIKTGRQVTLRDKEHKPREIMVAQWSPTDSSLIFVESYDIFYVPTAAKPNKVKQITFNGCRDLYNGVSDWIYKKEIFGTNSAVWFSKHGTKLAYATFNESLVPLSHITQFGIPDTMYDQYSKIIGYRYPKVNDPNPKVELFVQTLSITNETAPISIKPTIIYSDETILYQVLWSDDEHLFAMWMNRFQNESHLVHYQIVNNTAKVKEVMQFHQENGWLDFHRSILVNPEHRVVLIYRTEQSDGDTYGHICVVRPNGELRPITEGRYEVTRLIKWDFESNYLYYLANLADGYETQYVFRVLMDLKQQVIKPECLTCDTQCAINDAVFSKKSTYFSHICMGLKVPYVNIMKTNGSSITTWESNKNLKKELDNIILPGVIVVTVPLADGFDARVKLIIPPGVDMRSDKKYPLLIYPNGDLSGNLAVEKFKLDLNMYLSSNYEFIIAEVDARGTAGRGSDNLFANYMKLGTVEIDDQITVAKYMQDTFSYVDRDRTGIWGWGYGGYVAGMALAKDNEKVFKCALSVAPITDWIYYDSMFTERHLGSFKENFEMYQNASLVENAQGLRHKKYMIIHGMFDSNVHFQHSAILSKELQRKAIAFQQHFYPDEKHTFSNVRKHLYHTIISYMLNC